MEEKIYLKGYKAGFESAMKMAWAYAEELYIVVDNPADTKQYKQKA